VLLIRHGQSAGNVGGRLVGSRSDPELTERGAAQAAAAAAGRPAVSRIVASPARRAMQTAQALASAWGVPVEQDPRWREMDYGDWEGQAFGEIVRPEGGFFDSAEFRPPGGESLADMAARVMESLNDLRDESVAVAVVAHMGPIKMALLEALGAPASTFRRFRIDEASISEIGWRAGGWFVGRMNDVCHLSSV
jgi:probable phosphoglycerate mutase